LYGRTEKLKTGHGDLYLTINELDGQPFEVFAMLSKSGRTAAAKAEAIGRLVSLALRTGVEVDEIVSQLEGIGGDHQVFQEGGLVKSIPDGIARILKERYLNGTASWNEEDANPIEDTEEPESIPYVSHVEAQICPRCGQPSLRMDANCRGGECWNCFYSNCS
jgi:ribonucleoside-diphosphate reductase alpha chain